MRKASSSETEALYALRARSFELSCRADYSPGALQTLMWGYDPVEFASAIEAGNITVLEMNSRIAGYVWIERTYGKELVVDPAFWGKGAGKKLLLEGIRILTSQSSDDIEIFATLNAINFYRRYGFTPGERIEVAHRTTQQKLFLQTMDLTYGKAGKLLAPDLNKTLSV